MKEGRHIHLTSPIGADGTARAIVCNPDGTAEGGRVRPIREGESFKPGSRYLFAERDDVDPTVANVTHEIDLRGKTGAATPAYRDGWDRIFGAKGTVGDA